MMTAKSTNPNIVAKIFALRSAGWTLASIATQTGLSVSTVQRHLRKRKIVKGEALDELMAEARRQVKEDLASESGCQEIIEALIIDTSSQVRLARDKMAETLEHIKATDNESAALAFRALAAHSTAVKAHSDALRQLLPTQEISQDSLPELVVRVLDEEDVAELRRQQAEEDAIIRGHCPGKRVEEID